MASKWCVAPGETDKIDLVWPNGPCEKCGGDDEKCEVCGGTGRVATAFWVRLKQKLTVGEDRAIKTAGWKSVGGVGKSLGEQEMRIDWKANGLVRAITWLTTWSLTDEKDRPLPMTIDQLEALDVEVFELIENAITAHVAAIEAAKKKTTPGNKGS